MRQFVESTRGVLGYSIKQTLSVVSMLLVFAALHPVARGQVLARAADDSSQSCTHVDLNFDPATNPQAFKGYEETIAGLLKQEKFAEIDCLADSLRASKARFSGGAFKLHKLYGGLGEPMPGHPTEVDWHAHFDHLNRWVSENPRSIAARIALADSYVSYGWAARGNGYSDSVSDTGWKLFGERMDKAREVLEGATKLPTKDPEWYVVMQRVGRGKDWDDAQLQKVFEDAAAHYPEFEPYYRIRAVDKLPKWGGTDGEATRFAEQAADRMGGSAGDILYFQIATEIVCACVDPEFHHMSWPRLQKGFEALQAQYGESLFNWNVMALMAVEAQDPVIADAAFKHVGESWDSDTWRTVEWFHQQREWATQFAPLEARRRGIRAEAAANLQAPEGVAYKKEFDGKFAAIQDPCAQKAGSDREKFEFLVKVDKTGTAEDIYFTRPTGMAGCIAQALFAARSQNKALFPVPPHDHYWVPLEIDPAVVNTAAK